MTRNIGEQHDNKSENFSKEPQDCQSNLGLGILNNVMKLVKGKLGDSCPVFLDFLQLQLVLIFNGLAKNIQSLFSGHQDKRSYLSSWFACKKA